MRARCRELELKDARVKGGREFRDVRAEEERGKVDLPRQEVRGGKRRKKRVLRDGLKGLILCN